MKIATFSSPELERARHTDVGDDLTDAALGLLGVNDVERRGMGTQTGRHEVVAKLDRRGSRGRMFREHERPTAATELVSACAADIARGAGDHAHAGVHSRAQARVARDDALRSSSPPKK